MGWWTQHFGAQIDLQKVMTLQDSHAIFRLTRAGYDAVPTLAQALEDGGRVAAAAQFVLREIEPDDRGEGFFFSALSSKSSYTRWNAAMALGLLYSKVQPRDPGVDIKSVVDRLIDLTFSDSSARVQHSAGQALCEDEDSCTTVPDGRAIKRSGIDSEICDCYVRTHRISAPRRLYKA